MLTLKKSVATLLILTSITIIQAQTPQDALSVITTYAEDGNSVPTVADYVDLGMIEIGTHNIDAINNKIATLPKKAIDTAEKIQKLIDVHNLMIHSVLNVVTGFILTSETTPSDVPTVVDVEYTVQSGRHGNEVLPTGKIDAVDDIMEYFILNDFKIDVNNVSYTFSGRDLFDGDKIDLKIKLQGKDILEEYSF